ncbi:hypothetical protein [Roseibium sp. Sym1]|uniref:hypothetical protein n=1 Tax=Roseibium sp. Sym1 TaxID=3016006 RepID=UPI0022B38BB5|nr:hypothetical protein [Roseibium sp. Sym1]
MTNNKKNPDKYIWLVRGHKDPRNVRGWCSFETPEDTERTPKAELSAIRKTKAGLYLPASQFPKDNYPLPSDSVGAHLERVPQIFSSGFFFLSGESAEVLQKFDMGDGALHSTRLWCPDRKSRVPGEFFYLSQGNRKDGFLVELSPDAKPFGKNRWTLPPIPSDDQLFFSERVLNGPDIWWDKSIASYFFVSDRLAIALREVGHAEDWHLLRCLVVE